MTVSAETRAKMSAAHLGRPHSAEHRANIGAALRGRVLSAEHRAKISASQLGKPRGPGKPLSPEHREKIRAAMIRTTKRGRGRLFSLSSGIAWGNDDMVFCPCCFEQVENTNRFNDPQWVCRECAK